ncbi:MAG: cytochrome c-type biogenesis protein [Pseudomonadota bacterium]
MTRVVAALLFCFLAGGAFAVEPDEMLDDPALEARAQALDTQLRCVVCQSQAISESNAPLAKDMRVLVRERLKAGDSDAMVLDFLVDRYGDYVLLKPRVQSNTYLLWAFPVMAFFLAGVAGFVFIRRGRPSESAAPLSDEEQRKIERILKERG